MKKKIISSFFVVATFMLVFCQISFAQDMKGKFGLGARVAYVNYSGDELNFFGYDVDFDFDDAIMYGGNLTYFVQEYISFELSVDYVETDADVKLLGATVNLGEMEQIPILLTVRTHFSTNPKVNPYLGFGVGYYLNDFNVSGLVASVAPPGAELDPDDSIGFHVGGGVEIFFNENFAFNFDLKYIWNETDFEDKAPGYTTAEYSIDLDAFYVGVGLKFYF